MQTKTSSRKQLENAIIKLSNIRMELLKIEILTNGEYSPSLTLALEHIGNIKGEIYVILNRMNREQHEQQQMADAQ